MKKNNWKKWADDYSLFLLLVIGLAALWEWIVRMGYIPPFILPSPSAIINSLFENGQLLLAVHLPATLAEVSLGFLLSVGGSNFKYVRPASFLD